ncbi:MAG: DUF1887 family CARF protein [Motiliproteus sp.]
MQTIHICIISAHLEPNIIPLLQLQPNIAILVTSEEMQSQTDVLTDILKQYAPNITVEVKNKLPTTKIAEIEDFALQLDADITSRYPKAQCIYNATGGTKPMAIIFGQIFSSHILYTNTGDNQIQWLAPSTSQTAPITTESVLTPEIYLLANGKRLRQAQSKDQHWVSKVTARGPLTSWLAANMDKSLGNFIGSLNYLIRDDANGNAVLKNQGRRTGDVFRVENAKRKMENHPNERIQKCLRKMEECRLILWDSEEPYDISFQNKDACIYLSGGWLEEYAWLMATNAGCEEVLCSAQITDEHAPKLDIRNEIDCLLVHNNRMLIIECKTKSFGRKDQSDSDTLSKLDSITQHSSGTFGTGLLLSARRFGNKNTLETNISRAESLNIPILAAAELKNLPVTIRHWMSTGHVKQGS